MQIKQAQERNDRLIARREEEANHRQLELELAAIKEKEETARQKELEETERQAHAQEEETARQKELEETERQAHAQEEETARQKELEETKRHAQEEETKDKLMLRLRVRLVLNRMVAMGLDKALGLVIDQHYPNFQRLEKRLTTLTRTYSALKLMPLG